MLSHQSNELLAAREAEAIRLLNSGDDDLVLTQDHKEVVYIGLLELERLACMTVLELEHEWRQDHWWTRFGSFRTLGGLRKLQTRIIKGG